MPNGKTGHCSHPWLCCWCPVRYQDIPVTSAQCEWSLPPPVVSSPMHCWQKPLHTDWGGGHRASADQIHGSVVDVISHGTIHLLAGGRTSKRRAFNWISLFSARYKLKDSFRCSELILFFSVNATFNFQTIVYFGTWSIIWLLVLLQEQQCPYSINGVALFWVTTKPKRRDCS